MSLSRVLGDQHLQMSEEEEEEEEEDQWKKIQRKDKSDEEKKMGEGERKSWLGSSCNTHIIIH